MFKSFISLVRASSEATVGVTVGVAVGVTPVIASGGVSITPASLRTESVKLGSRPMFSKALDAMSISSDFEKPVD